MKKITASTFLVLAATLCLAAHADAQLTQYRFTGTVRAGNSNPVLGTTISGTVTIDEAAAAVDDDPDFIVRYGESAIEFETDTGFSASSAELEDPTLAADWDVPGLDLVFGPYDTVQLVSYVPEVIPEAASAPPNFVRLIQIFAGYAEIQENNSAPLTNWDPLAADELTISIRYFNIAPDIPRAEARFEIVTFEPVPTTILVNGVDTGIADFEYRGEQVSDLLDGIAEGAVQYGMYDSRLARTFRRLRELRIISESQMLRVLTRLTTSYYEYNVSRLASRLRRAELLTRGDARQLVQIATQSFEVPMEPNS